MGEDGKVVMECPSCHDSVEFDFSSFLDQSKKVPINPKTEIVKFPCPKCGIYYEPSAQVGGYAFLNCPTHGLFKTSNAVSLNFRKFCSKLGSAPNRNPGYYTSEEEKVKRYLMKVGEVEGITFFHNARIQGVNEKGNKVFYWLDFVIPLKRIAIECNPSIWHKMWNREGADLRKESILSLLGVTLIEMTEDDVRTISLKKKKWSTKLDPIFRSNHCG